MNSTATDLKGWELVELVASSMSRSAEDTWLKDKLIETLEAQNIEIDSIDLEVLRKYALKILTQSLTQELLHQK